MEKEDTPLKQIRTFQGDVAQALKKQRESLVSIQRAEQQHNKETKSRTKAKSVSSLKTGLLYFLGSVLFIALGGAGAWYVYTTYTERSVPPVELPANRFIYADSELVVKVGEPSREVFIKNLVDNLLHTPEAKVHHLVLKKDLLEEDRLLSTGEFLSILESKAPNSLVRALDPLFMLGSLGESVFLIIKLESFENTFAGMLAWERNLSRDLGPLLATAEPAKTVPPETTFIDLIDKNKDIRALEHEGRIIVLYSFLDNDTLIITDGLESLRTIIERLTQEKLSR